MDSYEDTLTRDINRRNAESDACQARVNMLIDDAMEAYESADVKKVIRTEIKREGDRSWAVNWTLTDIIECYANDLGEIIACLCRNDGKELVKRCVSLWAERQGELA